MASDMRVTYQMMTTYFTPERNDELLVNQIMEHRVTQSLHYGSLKKVFYDLQ